tara:strand:+ start:257 stop:571 length:315 start_codon:yes stop_codon:yes gene_type:complete
MRTSAALSIMALSLAVAACRNEAPAHDDAAGDDPLTASVPDSMEADSLTIPPSSGGDAGPARNSSQPRMGSSPAEGALRYQDKAREVTRQMQEQTAHTEEYLDR